jgi:cysteine desulfurase
LESLDSIYLDYNATSPLSKSVLNWLKSGDVYFGNPSSQHSAGKISRRIINQSSEKLYQTFNLADKDFDLFYHSGATEGMRTFVHSFSEWCRLEGRELLVCFSRTDHPCVAQLSEQYFGAHVRFYELKMNSNLTYHHEFNFNFLKDKKDNNPQLIILYHHLWVHNETGLVSDLSLLENFKNIPDFYLHIDAVQAPGKILNWRELKAGDIFTFSSHKFGAFKGIGFSFFKKSFKYNPMLVGGGQQSGYRGGTENLTGIYSTTLALDDLSRVDINETYLIREHIEQHLVQLIASDGGVVSQDLNRASNTIYFYLHNLSSDLALALFDLNGLMISAGSACSSGAAKESQIMKLAGLKKFAKNGLRLSLPFNHGDIKVEMIKQRLTEVFTKLRTAP